MSLQEIKQKKTGFIVLVNVALKSAIRDVRKSELEIEKAEVISKLADKYTKNQMMILVKEKIAQKLDQLDVQKEMNKQLMNKS